MQSRWETTAAFANGTHRPFIYMFETWFIPTSLPPRLNIGFGHGD
jgi:hypothetical protein